MKINDVALAQMDEALSKSDAMMQYIVARNGLLIRAEDSRMEACVLIAPAELNGLAQVAPFARLKVDRIPSIWLHSILRSARQHMPHEAMYQFHWVGNKLVNSTVTWRVSMPTQTGTPTALRFDDDGQAVIDLHSHNSMSAFFSGTDDADEQGLRFYAVIGRIDTDQPEIRVRVGVYGHHMTIPAELVFDGLGPFVEAIDISEPEDIEPLPFADQFERTCRVCGCTDEHGCENGCFWVDDDLCSNCGPVPPAKLSREAYYMKQLDKLSEYPYDR